MYIFYDSTGKIIGGVAADSPSVVLTRIPEGTTEMYLDDTQYADVWTNMGEYTIVNGVVTSTPIPDATKLANAQSAKKSQLDMGLAQTLEGGFKSTSTGHTFPSDSTAQNNFLAVIKAFELDSTKTSASFLTLDAGFVTLTQDEFHTVFLEGDKWKEAQYAQYQTLLGQVNSATTVDAVNAIVWTPAS